MDRLPTNGLISGMFRTSGRYWLCQLTGWGGWALINLFFAYQFASEYYLQPESKRNVFFVALFIDFAWGIVATHILRLVLKRIQWMRFAFPSVVTMFIIGTVSIGLGCYYGSKYTGEVTGLSFEQYERKERKEKAIALEKDLSVQNTAYYQYAGPNNNIDSSRYIAFTKIKNSTGWYRNNSGEWKYENPRKGTEFWGIFFTFILISLWLLIYLVWHYINKNRNDQIVKLQLEAMVKSLELKTIKSHINPHFIFNAHNSIRALVDENPERARRAITELSNILRSSLQVEKMETVPLEQELSIVKDYLALEQMRFEERLQVELDIDPDTLHQPVPPMMLQTLVENAIKHGISKRENGGVVRIISGYENNQHIIRVQNSGLLNTNNGTANEGFGVKSTRERLKILYAGKASFDIYPGTSEQTVEVKISLPVVKKTVVTEL
jgi:two-component sensor histidine kinase